MLRCRTAPPHGRRGVARAHGEVRGTEPAGRWSRVRAAARTGPHRSRRSPPHGGGLPMPHPPRAPFSAVAAVVDPPRPSSLFSLWPNPTGGQSRDLVTYGRRGSAGTPDPARATTGGGAGGSGPGRGHRMRAAGGGEQRCGRTRPAKATPVEDRATPARSGSMIREINSAGSCPAGVREENHRTVEFGVHSAKSISGSILASRTVATFSVISLCSQTCPGTRPRAFERPSIRGRKPSDRLKGSTARRIFARRIYARRRWSPEIIGRQRCLYAHRTMCGRSLHRAENPARSALDSAPAVKILNE